MMARVVIRKPEIPCFVLNSQVRVADWEQVCGTHQGQRQMTKPRSKAGHRTVLTNRVINAFYPCNADAIHTGQSRVLLMQLSFTQKMFELAAVHFRRRSGFHQTNRSTVLISPKFKPPIRCGRFQQSKRGQNVLVSSLRFACRMSKSWCQSMCGGAGCS
jgi:hypothetical protein